MIMRFKEKKTGSIYAQKIKFSIKGFLSKCDQIRSFLQIWKRLLERFLMENFICCAVLHDFGGKYLYLWPISQSFKISYLIATSVSGAFVRYALNTYTSYIQTMTEKRPKFRIACREIYIYYHFHKI